MPQEALGLLECKGLVALIEGSDAMLKAANTLFPYTTLFRSRKSVV